MAAVQDFPFEYRVDIDITGPIVREEMASIASTLRAMVNFKAEGEAAGTVSIPSPSRISLSIQTRFEVGETKRQALTAAIRSVMEDDDSAERWSFSIGGLQTIRQPGGGLATP